MPNQYRKGIRGILPHNVTGIPGNLVRVGSSSARRRRGLSKEGGMAKGHESQREETLSIFTIPSGGEDYSKSVSRGKGLGTVLSELLSVVNTPIRCLCDECKRRRLGPRRDGSSGLCSGSVRLPATRSIASGENDTGRIEDPVLPPPHPLPAMPIRRWQCESDHCPDHP